jgi:diadenosine tetraphosphate (Ap4A) HIT family hydrolase
MSFQLHPRLAEDCFKIGSLAVCELLMMNDSQYPWLILVPRREAREIYQLNAVDRQTLLDESCLIAETLQNLYQIDKAWPAPIWGKLPPCPYSQQQAQLEISKIQFALKEQLIDIIT